MSTKPALEVPPGSGDILGKQEANSAMASENEAKPINEEEEKKVKQEEEAKRKKEEEEKAKEAKAQDKSRPISSTPVPGTPW